MKRFNLGEALRWVIFLTGVVWVTVAVFGCIPESDCRPAPPKPIPAVRVIAESGWAMDVTKVTFEGHRYLLFFSNHWGGPVHDPACPCQTRAPEAGGADAGH